MEQRPDTREGRSSLSDHPIDAGIGSVNPILRPADQPRHGTLESLTRRRWVSLSARLGWLLFVLGVCTALIVALTVVILAAAVMAAAG
jgi:hypothetical protein